MALKVFYGFTKLTQKAIKKRELAVIFENDYSYKNEDKINRIMHVAYVRDQTKEEAEDGKDSTRMFTKYSKMIDSKPYNGNIELVLESNFKADENNVSLEIREEIMNKLRDIFRTCFK